MDAGQYGGMITTIAGGLGGIALAMRWGLGRIAKSFDDMAAAFKQMAVKHEGEERELVRLGGVVSESRADAAEALAAARETRELVIERLEPLPRRTGSRRAITPPGG